MGGPAVPAQFRHGAAADHLPVGGRGRHRRGALDGGRLHQQRQGLFHAGQARSVLGAEPACSGGRRQRESGGARRVRQGIDGGGALRALRLDAQARVARFFLRGRLPAPQLRGREQRLWRLGRGRHPSLWRDQLADARGACGSHGRPGQPGRRGPGHDAGARPGGRGRSPEHRRRHRQARQGVLPAQRAELDRRRRGAAAIRELPGRRLRARPDPHARHAPGLGIRAGLRAALAERAGAAHHRPDGRLSIPPPSAGRIR